MEIGVVTVRGKEYHPNMRLLEAAEKRGISLEFVNPYSLGSLIRQGRPEMTGLNNIGPPGVLIPRQGAQIGESSMNVLRHFEAMGVPMVNRVSGITAARNKFLTMQLLSQHGIRVPDAVFINSRDMLYEGTSRLGGFPVVAKKPVGRQGGGVFLLKGIQEAESVLVSHLEPGQGLVLQSFIPPECRMDLRVLVIGGRVAASMELEVGTGDFRSNFHVSERSRAAVLSEEIEKIAVDSALALGLDIAGVDIIVEPSGRALVIEVNYSPGFRGLEEATGMDIALQMVGFAVSLIKNS